MTVWWGLAGLLGLLGCCGLLRSHRAAEDDPLARYPVAREPATPNADAAHTPLMTPAITPEMLARPEVPTPPRREAAVPESGSIAGEIPAPRPVAPEVAAPAGVSAVAGRGRAAWEEKAPGGARPRAVSGRVRVAREESSAPEAVRPQPRTAETPQPPEHARSEEAPAAAPETPRVPQDASPREKPERPSIVRTFVGRAKRLLRRN